MRKILLFDGTGMVYRGYYALKNLKNSQGQAVGGILGFFNILFKELTNHKPSHFALCFDRKEPTHRKLEYPEYKANRSKAPDELYEQMGIIKQILQNGLNIVESAGDEADDLIACLNSQKQSSDQVFVYSSDLDLLQLADQNTTIIKPGNSKIVDSYFTPEKIYEKYQLTPEQIIDYKGIKGDSSDNLKGIKGIGDKTATKLLNEYGNLENIYANLHQLTPKIQEKFLQDKETAFMCKRLATLNHKIANCPPLENFQNTHIEYSKLQAEFEKLEFKNIYKKINTLKVIMPNLSQQTSLFA